MFSWLIKQCLFIKLCLLLVWSRGSILASLLKIIFYALYNTCNLIKLYLLLLWNRDWILESDNVSNCLTASDSRTSLLDSRTSLSKVHSVAVRIHESRSCLCASKVDLRARTTNPIGGLRGWGRRSYWSSRESRDRDKRDDKEPPLGRGSDQPPCGLTAHRVIAVENRWERRGNRS